MPAKSDRQHFIIKHGLDALTAYPGYIWNDVDSHRKMPRGYGQIKRQDRWIAFAFANNDNQERRLSLVTGFYECTGEARYTAFESEQARHLSGRDKAWMIPGKPFGKMLSSPVGVPSIPQFLNARRSRKEKMPFNQATISRISEQEFNDIHQYVKSNWLDDKRIPLLRRQPTTEQEVLAIVAAHHEQLGIEKIVRIQTAFPDLCVKLLGSKKIVHLELELYCRNFFAHAHHERCKNRCFGNEAVAVLCWINDDDWVDYGRRTGNKNDTVKKHVHRVFELRELIRDGGKIRL